VSLQDCVFEDLKQSLSDLQARYATARAQVKAMRRRDGSDSSRDYGVDDDDDGDGWAVAAAVPEVPDSQSVLSDWR
jgi:hypothetical protein